MKLDIFVLHCLEVLLYTHCLHSLFKESKHIPSIFNDESTGSFICLRRHIYMSHVNKVQQIRVKILRMAAIRRASLGEAWFFIESLLSLV
jgi:hypothetical protein